MKVAWSRALPADPSSVTVIRASTGKYYASFVVALDDDAEMLPPAEADTGIDLGLKDFAVLRNGKTIPSPRFFLAMERRLKKAQRRLSRKQRGSANQVKARSALAILHDKVRSRRDDWLNKQVSAIVAENQGIYVEDLCVRGLVRGRHARSFHDQALGQFLARLESKAARAGRSFAKVDRFFPSTQLCSACGAITGPKGLEELSIRTWSCPCGVEHDRDENAEMNIRREGRRLAKVAAGSAETRNASGEQVRPGQPGAARNPR
jgi:IS605 OrfB family transposase